MTSVTERFSSPDDLRPLIQQQPNYDYAITEHQGTSGVFTVQSGSGAQIFQPPAWLQEYKNTGQIDPAEVRVGQQKPSLALGRIRGPVTASSCCCCCPCCGCCGCCGC